jgi:hypothetical protein
MVSGNIETLEDRQQRLDDTLDLLVKQVKKLVRIENERLKSEKKMLESLTLTGTDKANAARFNTDEIVVLNELDDLLGNIG